MANPPRIMKPLQPPFSGWPNSISNDDKVRLLQMLDALCGALEPKGDPKSLAARKLATTWHLLMGLQDEREQMHMDLDFILDIGSQEAKRQIQDKLANLIDSPSGSTGPVRGKRGKGPGRNPV